MIVDVVVVALFAVLILHIAIGLLLQELYLVEMQAFQSPTLEQSTCLKMLPHLAACLLGEERRAAHRPARRTLREDLLVSVLFV